MYTPVVCVECYVTGARTLGVTSVNTPPFSKSGDPMQYYTVKQGSPILLLVLVLFCLPYLRMAHSQYLVFANCVTSSYLSPVHRHVLARVLNHGRSLGTFTGIYMTLVLQPRCGGFQGGIHV